VSGSKEEKKSQVESGPMTAEQRLSHLPGQYQFAMKQLSVQKPPIIRTSLKTVQKMLKDLHKKSDLTTRRMRLDVCIFFSSLSLFGVLE
jgi:hypothetical protein